ncbi:MAG: phage portal protein [Paracoccus sp. (in: a-proteobacteria)]|uniref:phage portal protein n=1 Tax=Paracoccus sp. TaxID=267 RepID=UPI0026E0CF9C|nr:phage portal protein [Paracoccus sp. (in: a-proteobacteria)]MDO5621926.1 phage portal protein [Paracoccus sp. (in: a-proteobacteria)]
MKLLRKMFGRRDEMRPVDLQNHTAFRLPGGDAGPSVTADSSLAVAAVWGCVNLISGTISSLPLQVYQDEGGGKRRFRRDLNLYSVLHDSPNADQTALDFWDFVTMSLELWGNAFARIERLGGQIVGLVPVWPNRMQVRRASDGVLRYRWTADGRQYDLPDTDMLHVRGPGGDPLGGMSTLAFARRTFSMAMAADESASGFFRNGMRPSGVLKFADWLSDENRQIAREYMLAEFMGAANNGRPFIAEGGVEWQSLIVPPADAQMLETRSFSIEEICRFFGVPPILIQHYSKATSWPTGVEQQVLIFQKFTLRRRLKRFEQAMEKQLLTLAERQAGVRIEFNLEGLLRGDSAGRAAFYKSALNDGWMTINEVRAKENLAPVDGGDVPRIQKQNVPISDLEALIAGETENGG